MRLVKRKKYYYLQHSFKDNNKTITREKYLGKIIPDTLEKIKEEFNLELKEILYKKLEKIKNNFQEEWKRYPASAKEKELQEIAISFTNNTNAIEGSTIPLEEPREIIKDKMAPKRLLRDIKETENHFKLFLEILSKKEDISNELILNWHKEIFHETKEDISGRYREHLVRVSNYIAPDWQDVKKLMNNLIKFIKESKINPVELSGIAHYRFEKIHPFSDGNGRIGRLLMNYILWHNNYPMIIITYKDRKAYYKSFKKDEDKFVKYFIKRYIKIHKRLDK